MPMKHLLALLLPAFMLLPAPAAEKPTAPAFPKTLANQPGRGILKGMNHLSTKLNSINMQGLGGKVFITYPFNLPSSESADMGMLLVMATPKGGTSWVTRDIPLTEALAPAGSSEEEANGPNHPQGQLQGLPSRLAGICDQKNNQVFFVYEGRRVERKGDELRISPRPCYYCINMKLGKKPEKERDITRRFGPQSKTSATTPRSLLHHGLRIRHGDCAGRLILLSITEDNSLISVYSDDEGKSWEFGEPFDLIGIRKANRDFWDAFAREALLCEAANGDLIAYRPHHSINPCISSTNGGITWELTSHSPETQYENMGETLLLLEPESRNTPSGKLIATCYEENEKGEPALSISLSYDWGKSWKFSKKAELPGESKALCPAAPGLIGMMYSETAPRQERWYYTEFTLAWLTNGKDSGLDISALGTDEKEQSKKSSRKVRRK